MININKLNCIIQQITSTRSINCVINNETDINISNNNENDEYMKLDELPSPLLFEISSYLNISEALQFEKVNGSTYIASKSSKRPIHSLSGPQFTKLVKYYHENEECRHQIRLFKGITINADNVCQEEDEESEECKLLYDFDEFALDLFKHIESITIKSELQLSTNLSTILLFLQWDEVDLSNLKTFRLFLDNEQLYSYDVNLIRSIIHNKAKNIQHFEIDSWFEKPVFNQSDFQWISKLTGFKVTDQNGEYENVEPLYLNIGSNLDSAHQINIVTEISQDIISKLMNISEICIDIRDLFDAECKILLKEEFNYLKRMHLNCYEDVINEKYALSLMKKLIKNLECICLDFGRYSAKSKLLDIISKSVRFSVGKTLKIRINEVALYQDEEINAFKNQLEELIKYLDSFCINWMLIVHKLEISTVIPLEFVMNIKRGMRENDFDYIVNDETVDKFDIELKRKKNNDVLDKFLEKKSQIYHVRSQKMMNEEKYEEYNFVVSNVGCCINGYQDRWNMICSDCNQVPVFK